MILSSDPFQADDCSLRSSASLRRICYRRRRGLCLKRQHSRLRGEKQYASLSDCGLVETSCCDGYVVLDFREFEKENDFALIDARGKWNLHSIDRGVIEIKLSHRQLSIFRVFLRIVTNHQAVLAVEVKLFRTPGTGFDNVSLTFAAAILNLLHACYRHLRKTLFEFERLVKVGFGLCVGQVLALLLVDLVVFSVEPPSGRTVETGSPGHYARNLHDANQLVGRLLINFDGALALESDNFRRALRHATLDLFDSGFAADGLDICFDKLVHSR